MKYPNFSWMVVTVIVVLMIMGCSHQQVSKTETKPSKTEAKSAPSQQMMKIAFAHPVIAVNGIRAAEQSENVYQEKIEVSYPENSVQDISLTVISDGEEHSLQGKMDVFRYTKFSKISGEDPEIVWVVPSNPEYVYSNIIRNGYGEFTVREKTRNIQQGELEGPVVLKLKLGTKKKTDSNQVEFRFREGSISTVNGQKMPVILNFPTNSKQNLELTIDEGGLRLQGDLQVYEGNYYTQWAPVWITIPETLKESLREKGGQAELSMCVPASFSQAEQDYVTMLETGQDTAITARQYGKLIGLLKLRRVRQ